jgi:hypothetical protein
MGRIKYPGRLHQQPRKDPVNRLMPVVMLSDRLRFLMNLFTHLRSIYS